MSIFDSWLEFEIHMDDVVSGDTELSYKKYSKLYILPKNLFENIRFIGSE